MTATRNRPSSTWSALLRAKSVRNSYRPRTASPTFDQAGTLWGRASHAVGRASHDKQVVYFLDRVPAVVAQNPQLKNVEPFKTVLSGKREAIANLSTPDLEKILIATLTGMTVDEFSAQAKKWLEAARHSHCRNVVAAIRSFKSDRARGSRSRQPPLDGRTGNHRFFGFNNSRQPDGEGRAATGLTLYRDVAAHHLTEALADHEPEPRTAVFARRRGGSL